MWLTGPLVSLLWCGVGPLKSGNRSGQPERKTIYQSLIKLNIHLPYDLTAPLIGIYPRGKKACVHTKTCSQMSTQLLFLTAPNWKHPKYPSTGDWVNKLRRICAVGHVSAIKRSRRPITRHHTWPSPSSCWVKETKKGADPVTACFVHSSRTGVTSWCF